MAIQYPVIIQNKQLTEAGQGLIDFIEATIKATAYQADNLNKLAGHYKFYYVNVLKGKHLTPTEFAEQFQHSSMRAAHEDMMFFKEAATAQQTLENTAVAVDETAKAFADFKEAIEADMKAMKKYQETLKGMNTGLRNRIAQLEAEADAEEDAEDAEDAVDTDDNDSSEESDS